MGVSAREPPAPRWLSEPFGYPLRIERIFPEATNVDRQQANAKPTNAGPHLTRNEASLTITCATDEPAQRLYGHAHDARVLVASGAKVCRAEQVLAHGA